MSTTRREFCMTALLAVPVGLASSAAVAEASRATPPADVAAFERERVIAAAEAALALPVLTLPPAPAQAKAEPQHFYSEDPEVVPSAFRAQAEALLQTSRTIATLTAAFLLTNEARFAMRAGNHLFAWFVDTKTRIAPAFELAGSFPADAKGAPLDNAAGLLDAVPLAEIARSMAFLVDSPALSPPDIAAAHAWFQALLDWLTTARIALLARDHKDRVASAWLLITAASARMLKDEATLAACRKLFRHQTLRSQMAASGAFSHEITTSYPYRNSLQNFDLLAGACELLMTPFENPWQFELADGPGMRAVAAYLYPLIAEPARWPFPADAAHFRELPSRCTALLLAGRAYKRDEYIALWKALPYKADEPALRASFPLSEPLLWVTRPPHGG